MAPKKRKVSVARLNKFQPLTKYKKVLRSKQTVEGVVAREAARAEGKKAAVRIAKARVAKQKKAPFTEQAIGLNKSARRNRDAAKDLTNYLAYEEGYYTKSKQGNRRQNIYLRKRVLAKQAQLEAQGSKTNPIYDHIKRKEFSASRAAAMSKDNARKSGGYATAMKRNAEAGIEHIVRGRAMKGVARASGVLGIASLFAQHLAGRKDKKNG